MHGVAISERNQKHLDLTDGYLKVLVKERF